MENAVNAAASTMERSGDSEPETAHGSLQWITLDQWQEFVESRPESHPFHHANWLRLLIDQYGYAWRIAALVAHGEITAALPFLITRTLHGRRKLLALPLTDWFSVLASQESSADALLAMLQCQPWPGFQSVSVRTDLPAGSATPWVRHQMRLPADSGELRHRFPESLRRNLKRVERDHVRFERRTDAESLAVFYDLHVRTRCRQGVPVQPKSFFRRLQPWIVEPGLGYVGLVTKSHTPIAAGVFLNYGSTAVYKYGASDPQALAHRPNECLMYGAMRAAVDGGCARFDFGITDVENEGLRRFKRKWGAHEIPVGYRFLAGGGDAKGATSAAMRIAGPVIRRSPLIVCRLLGEVLYKFSP